MSTPFKTVAFHTMGCKLNYSESSMLQNQLNEHGYQTVNFKDGADYFIINSCSVTNNADKECRKLIRRAKRISPRSKIAVIGCYAQLKPEEIIKIDGVNLVLGTDDKFNLLEKLEAIQSNDDPMIFRNEITSVNQFNPSWSLGERTRSFLKIQDGCDYNCSFCTIPMARGKSRNQSIERTLITAREAASSLARELVLTGVNIGDFGKSSDESFMDLIRQLDMLDDIDRIRISSIEPNLLSDDIIEFVTQSKKFMPHFHIPLQSGSELLLKNMRRRYTVDLYRKRIEKIKNVMPNCCIGVDVIVGFPGETETEFQETIDFLSDLDFSYLHVFTYSERSGTDAVKFKNAVPVHVRKARSKILHQLSESKKTDFYAKHLNTTSKILFESFSNGWVEGWSENYIRVKVPGNVDMINTIESVRLTKFESTAIEGEILS